MKQRSPIAVFFLSIVTFGIYSIVWLVKTKNEMNNRGASIPTAWLIIIPFVSIYWMYKYSEGVEYVTGGKVSTVLAFVVQLLLGFVGYAILQNEFNKVGESSGGLPAWQPNGATPASLGQPVGPQPDNSFGGPVTPTQAPAYTPDPAAQPVSVAPSTFSPSPEATSVAAPANTTAPANVPGSQAPDPTQPQGPVVG